MPMMKGDFREGMAVKLPATGEIFLVLGIKAGKLHVMDEAGQDRIFSVAGPLVEASLQEQLRLEGIEVKRPKPAASGKGTGASPKVKDNPDWHKKHLALYRDKVKAESPEALELFDVFWKKLLKRIPDEAGRRWTVRDSPTLGLNPVVMVPGKTVGRWVQFLHLFFHADRVGLIVVKNRLHPKFAGLFGKSAVLNGGTGLSKTFTLDEFDAQAQEKYLSFIAESCG